MGPGERRRLFSPEQRNCGPAREWNLQMGEPALTQVPLRALTFEACWLAATLQHCANICVERGTFSYPSLAENPKGLLLGALMDIYLKSSGA